MTILSTIFDSLAADNSRLAKEAILTANKNNKDLQQYDVYRTYKKKNIKMIKELYFDVSKLKPKLGFKNFNIDEQEII